MDRAVIKEFYTANFNKLVKRVARRVPSIEDAEDIVQESFVRALIYGDKFNPELASLEVWFSNIINNVQRDFKRKEMVTSEIKEEDWYTKEADEYEDDEFVCNQIKECISNEKFAHHRDVLFSHFVVGNKVGEVARQLNMSLSTVKIIVQRFKKKVGEKYEV